MIQATLKFRNTEFMTTELMNSSIGLLYNEQPIVLPQLMYIIPTSSGTYS